MLKREKRYGWMGSAVLALAAPLLTLTGCVPSQPVGGAAESTPQATAPALQPAVQATPAVTPEQAAAAERQKRVQALVRQVEASYAQGEANYRKGKLPEAKANFDRAVDLMLSSGLDIRNEQPLQEEFDRIVDGVNALEMEALKQGNGFVAKEEPTPADVASDVTFQVDPNFMAKAKADLATTKSDLPLVMNDYVAAFVNFFANTTRGHYTLLHSFQRAGRYKAMIQRVMAEEGVPQDLIYLAVAESSFNPRAMNAKSHAGGMWQFMPSGNYGLVRNSYVDERFDPEKSTRASARYMKFIHDELGDWYLTMAGYNWGTGNVQRAVQKTGYADFWELYKRNNLPAETKNYVPEILAAIIIANHPTQYGFDDITLDPPVLTDTVSINYSVDLHLVSDIVGAPMDEMTALNPSLLRMVTPPDASFDLHLPAGTADLYTKAIAAVPENKRNAWRYHRVKEGDTMASIAHEYHVTPADLAEANQMGENDSLAGVEALVAPVAPVAAPSSHTMMYTARKGDTLVNIADRFGVSLDDLRHWNKMTGIKVDPGRRLHVGEATNATHASRSHKHGASAETVVGSSAKAHETGRSKSATSSSKAKSTGGQGDGTAAGQEKSSSSRQGSVAGKSGSTSARHKHTESVKPAPAAKKSDSAGTKKSVPAKSSTAAKTSTHTKKEDK
jgi:membrane-bound lytic murein transglycosylase D